MDRGVASLQALPKRFRLDNEPAGTRSSKPEVFSHAEGVAMSQSSFVALVTLFFSLPAPPLQPETWASRSKTPSVPDDASTFARRVWALTDLILEHHVAPPTRQEMLLAGVKALYGIPGSTRAVTQWEYERPTALPKSPA